MLFLGLVFSCFIALLGMLQAGSGSAGDFTDPPSAIWSALSLLSIPL